MNKPNYTQVYPQKDALKHYFRRLVKAGKVPINGKIFMPVKASKTTQPGLVIVPEDGSYIQFISNTWYHK